MLCRECARLKARLSDLRLLHSRTSAAHLQAVQLGNTDNAWFYEAAILNQSKTVADAEKRLAKHRLNCVIYPPLR